MKRVRLDVNGLITSKAGFDVDSAPPSGISFTTNLKSFSVLMQGSVALSAFTVDSDTTSGGVRTISSHYDVFFPYTFAVSPMCFVGVQDPLLPGAACVNYHYTDSNVQTYYGGTSFNYGTGGSSGITFTVDTTKLRLLYGRTIISYSPPVPAFADYTVLRFS
jgi:hypothetical protein